MNLVESPTLHPAWIRSIGFHLALAVLLFVVVRRSEVFVEVPIEISEILTRTQATNQAPPTLKRPPPNPQQARPTVSEPGASTTNPTTTTSATNPNTDNDSPNIGPVAEEYEVGEMPILLNEVRVAYPPGARNRGVQGNVVFDLVVGSNGKVAQVTLVSSPDPDLSEAASTAVRGFKFKPARVGDKAVAIRIRYSYRFILE